MEKEFLVILYNFTIDFAIKLIKLKINVEFSFFINFVIIIQNLNDYC